MTNYTTKITDSVRPRFLSGKKLHYLMLIVIVTMMMKSNAFGQQENYCLYGVLDKTGNCPAGVHGGVTICVTCIQPTCPVRSQFTVANSNCVMLVQRLGSSCLPCPPNSPHFDWATLGGSNMPTTWTYSTGNKYIHFHSSDHDTTLHFTVVNVSDTPKKIILHLSSTYPWATFPGIPDSLDFGPYEYKEFNITVTVPGGTPGCTSNVFTLSAQTNGIPESTTQASASIKVVQSFLNVALSTTNVTCSGGSNGSINALVSGESSPYSFAWSNGATTQNINGVMADNYTLTVTDQFCNGGEGKATVTEPPAIYPAINPPGNVSICSGSSLTLVANYDPNVTYQWRKGNKNVNGATNQTYTVKQAYSYSVRETNSGGCSATSAPTTITVNPAPTATITAPDGLDLCGHSSLQLQASAAVSYGWQKGVTIISGATNQTYSATSKGNYKVIVTNEYGCSKTSGGAKVVKTCKEGNPNAELSQTELLIYPNPADGKFILDLNLNSIENTQGMIQVLDLVGRVMYEQIVPVGDGKLHKEIQLDAISDGIYFVKVIVNDDVYSNKLVILKH